MYEHFEHTADLGLRVRAASLDELFAEAGRGLCAMFVADPNAVRPLQEKRFQIAGGDPEYLLFDWLTELLFTFDTEKLLLALFDVQVRGTGLTATARGEPMDPARHALEHEVKAITYHALKVVRENGGWLAEVIVDI